MSLRIIGPLAFATMLFVVESAIKGIAFNSKIIWFEIGPKLCLWATGIFFSLSISEQTQLRGKTTYRVKKKVDGSGLEVDYDVKLPNDLSFTPKFLYLFVFAMSIWILSVIISSKIISVFYIAGRWTFQIHILTYLVLLLAGVTVGVAIKSLVEVAT